MSNRLANENSPYLLQHSNNPVNWYPWGHEAFRIALKEDKPLFISIGYSTCHWCHIMEKESFEDNEVAAILNSSFISIKVDREERPDIDSIYMTVCQMLTSSGGWPLTIIATPDKMPFFAGTYFPKESKWGKIGLLELLPKIIELWNTKRGLILENAKSIVEHIQKNNQYLNSELPDNSVFTKAYIEFQSSYDYVHGGFGQAPKFPTPHNLNFLLRYHISNPQSTALEMVENTLHEMRFGGIFDQLAFGFHRYSTDEKWLVPHFEKMLYDQAQLLDVYLETYQLTQKEFYLNVSNEILNYITNNLYSAEGAFYSAEDADSEGEEGKYYLWDINEIYQSVDYPEIFCELYGVKENGNFYDHTTQSNDKNILYQNTTINDIAKRYNISFEELNMLFEKQKNQLLSVRNKRIRPNLDDKILTDWNCLMIASLAKGYQITKNIEYLEVAEKAMCFIIDKMMTQDNILLHRYRNADAAITGNLDDYSFFIYASIVLFQATQNVKYLKNAIAVNSILDEFFLDKENGGYFFTSSESETLIIRKKEIYDGAIPSGNSIQLQNLLYLWKFTGDSKYETNAISLIKCFSMQISRYPSAFSKFLCSYHFISSNPIEIVFIEESNSFSYFDFCELLSNYFIPNKILFNLSEDNKDELIAYSPFLNNLHSIDSKSTVYICENNKCDKPLNDIFEIKEFLKSKFNLNNSSDDFESSDE